MGTAGAGPGPGVSSVFERLPGATRAPSVEARWEQRPPGSAPFFVGPRESAELRFGAGGCIVVTLILKAPIIGFLLMRQPGRKERPSRRTEPTARRSRPLTRRPRGSCERGQRARPLHDFPCRPDSATGTPRAEHAIDEPGPGGSADRRIPSDPALSPGRAMKGPPREEMLSPMRFSTIFPGVLLLSIPRGLRRARRRAGSPRWRPARPRARPPRAGRPRRPGSAHRGAHHRREHRPRLARRRGALRGRGGLGPRGRRRHHRRHPLPDLVDEQADHDRGDASPARAGAVRVGRPRGEVHPGLRRPEGEGRRRNAPGNRGAPAHRAPDDAPLRVPLLRALVPPRSTSGRAPTRLASATSRSSRRSPRLTRSSSSPGATTRTGSTRPSSAASRRSSPTSPTTPSSRS